MRVRDRRNPKTIWIWTINVAVTAVVFYFSVPFCFLRRHTYELSKRQFYVEIITQSHCINQIAHSMWTPHLNFGFVYLFFSFVLNKNDFMITICCTISARSCIECVYFSVFNGFFKNIFYLRIFAAGLPTVCTLRTVTRFLRTHWISIADVSIQFRLMGFALSLNSTSRTNLIFFHVSLIIKWVWFLQINKMINACVASECGRRNKHTKW